MFDRRISIFTGHFGSGKTEVAINFALKLKEKWEQVAIADFDIVNPYFRTADSRAYLEERGIGVIAPLYANTNVDVPALPPEVNALFENRDVRVVLDAGGDPIGAKVLSRYRDWILKDEYDMFLVVNARRPMTDTREKIEEMAYAIMESSGLSITGLVNNTNVLEHTTPEHVLSGQRLIEGVSQRLKIPVAFISGLPGCADLAASMAGARAFSLERRIKLPWEA